MLSPHIYAAFAQERHQSFLAQAETDRRNRQARLQRQHGSATAAATDRPVVLRDGSAVLIRPVRRADAALLADGFARLSTRSRRLRFLSPKKELSSAELGYFTDVDHHDHEALGALDHADGRGVGIARYIRDAVDPQAAEIAVTVIDDWQGRGLGLRVRSVKGDFEVQVQATDDPADIGPCDFVLFCVKTFDTDAAAARLGPLLGDGTAVVSLQNGVENEEKLARAVGEDHVMGGAAFIFAGIAEPGVIVHSGGPASITFGELDGRATQRARCLLAWCERAGFQAELSASISSVLWAKLAFICAQAGMTAAVRLPIGEIRTVDAAWAAFKSLVAEVCAVAEADDRPGRTRNTSAAAPSRSPARPRYSARSGERWPRPYHLRAWPGA